MVASIIEQQNNLINKFKLNLNINHLNLYVSAKDYNTIMAGVNIYKTPNQVNLFDIIAFDSFA